MSNVTPVSEWKKKSGPTPLDLPSGNTCLVQPVGMDAFLKQGFIPNSLLGIVQKALAAGEAQKLDEINTDEMMAQALQDPEKLQGIFDVADSVTVYCVVEPRVYPVPTDTTVPREEDKLYVDEIDMDDKLFIFNFAVGGSRDLEAFRQGTTVGVGSVPVGDSVQLPAEQSAGDPGGVSSVLSGPGGEVLRGHPEQSP